MRPKRKAITRAWSKREANRRRGIPMTKKTRNPTKRKMKSSMTRTHWIVLAIFAVVFLVVVAVAFLIMGIATTQAGRELFTDILQNEQVPQVSHPKTVVRDKFKLEYPSNWNIDVKDEEYDPDRMFMIKSPGSTFVMFALIVGKTTPEECLRIQMRPFEKKMARPSVVRFERYGRYTGKGATLKGRLRGIPSTVKLFSFRQGDLEVMMTQYCPDEDQYQVQSGLRLIEKSFMMTAGGK
jgi:hypothetical protein